MSLRVRLSLRVAVLAMLWLLPLVLYAVLGLIAMFQTGWLHVLAWTLPVLWLAAWLAGRYWQPPKMSDSSLSRPMLPAEFWTPQDAAALQIAEDFRRQLPEIDRVSIADPNRYLADAQALSQRLATHYYPDRAQHAYRPLTIVEILAVIHLSVEDLESWMLDNVPGSNRVTIGHLEQVPGWVQAFDVGQKLFFFASSLFNPAKLLSYPVWRSAGRLSVELQNEAMRGFYQHYLQQISFYLIEMYSGRLRGGSREYRQRFGKLSSAVHQAAGHTDLLETCQAVDTTIAVMGQVKAGKSSLINALMKGQVAATSVLPETRHVQRYDLKLHETDTPQQPAGNAGLVLLDTPGYSEEGISRQQRSEIERAADLADIILLVMSASSPAKDSDVQLIRQLHTHYQQHPHLRPPTILAVLTHIDQLRPVREWSPPYNWRSPVSPKEQAIAGAVEYVRQLMGPSIAGYACVFTGQDRPQDTSVADEVVPLLVDNLSHGHATAVLKAFYRGLSQRRYAQLLEQLGGMVRSVLGNR